MKLLNTALRFIKKHDTQIMTGIAIAGAIATPILASRATLKAKEAIDDLESEISPEGVNPENEGEEMGEVTTLDKAMTAAPYYIWTALALGTTIFCILRCEALHLGREASLMGISAFWEHRYKTLNSKFIDKCGEEAVKQAKKEIAKEYNALEKEYQRTGKTTLKSEDGSKEYFRVDRNTPFTVYDPLGEDYNETTLNDLSAATCMLNQRFSGHYYYDRVTYNDFRRFLGWKKLPGEKGNIWSWDGADEELIDTMSYNGDMWLDIILGGVEGVDPLIDKDGKQVNARVLWFNYPPTDNVHR